MFHTIFSTKRLHSYVSPQKTTLKLFTSVAYSTSYIEDPRRSSVRSKYIRSIFIVRMSQRFFLARPSVLSLCLSASLRTYIKKRKIKITGALEIYLETTVEPHIAQAMNTRDSSARRSVLSVQLRVICRWVDGPQGGGGG